MLPPSAPLNMAVDSFDSSFVTTSWELPLNNGGLALSGFKVNRESCDDSTSTPTTLATLPASQFSYTDTTVTGGICYQYTVLGYNALGGDGSESSKVKILPIEVPSGAQAPTEVAATQNSISVEWAVPTSDGDSEISYYTLYMKAEHETSYKQVYEGASRFYRATLLDTGFYYQFKVSATNSAGASSQSAASASILTAETPDTPLNLDLEERSDSAIKISWTAPVEKGGVALTGYKVYMATGSAEFAELTSAAAKTDPDVTSHTESGLTAAQEYRFRVTAYNPVGESVATESIYVIAADLPESPANAPTIDTVTESYLTFTLTAIPLANNGGSAVTGYLVQMDDGLGGDYTLVHDSTTLTVTLSNLVAGRTYRLKYAGRNIVYDANNMFDCDVLQWSAVAYATTTVEP